MNLLYSHFFIAQAYGCGTYGQATYNQCETDQSQSTQNPQTGGAGGNAGTNQQSQPTDQSQLQETATPEQSGDYLEPTEVIGQPSGPTTETGPMSGIGFDFILLWSFIVALLIALIIFLLKRRRKHNNDQDQFDGPTVFPQS